MVHQKFLKGAVVGFFIRVNLYGKEGGSSEERKPQRETKARQGPPLVFHPKRFWPSQQYLGGNLHQSCEEIIVIHSLHTASVLLCNLSGVRHIDVSFRDASGTHEFTVPGKFNKLSGLETQQRWREARAV